MTKQYQSEHLNDIAVIGMSARFPGAANVEEFWANLRNGVESITFFSDEELLAAGVPSTTLKNPNYVKAGPALGGIELFDHAFFGFTLGEAEFMDPQHRLLLQCAWETLEDGGYDPESYKGAVGVFAGCAGSTYLTENLISRPNLSNSKGTALSSLSLWNERDSLSTLVSYKLNLTGPSFTVQTFCSTSLVTVHLACQSLLNGESDMALAGGVNIRVPQEAGYLYEEGMILSPDGHTRAFDARAEGTVFGSGVGLVLLKPLSYALRDGDFIHAVIKGSAINNDGSQKAGYAAPSVARQSKVITEALGVAGVMADSISFLETHGTGTAIGDPIEVEALTRAFQQSTQRKQFCPIISVKSNVGHLDRAAGIASLIAAILALEHHEIPASLHFEKPNPTIDFANSPFFVNTRLLPWKNNGTPMRAGVTSLGFGGTNAHIVLEEAPASSPSGASRKHQLIVLSAKTNQALDEASSSLLAHLKEQPDANLADVAYTLQVGRGAFNYRRTLVCRDVHDAITALETKDSNRIVTQSLTRRDPPVVFMFPGQGAQFVNMGAELYRSESLFREEVDRCAALLRPHLGMDLREVLYPAADRVQEAEEQLIQTRITQPALFVTEYALAQLWMSWGVKPAAMIGHSVGEYVAGCLSGVFRLEDALALVAHRAQMVQALPGGAMLAARLPEAEIASLLETRLSIAALNSPFLCVVSGPIDAIETLEAKLESKHVPNGRLHSSHAFHSSMMDPVVEPFHDLLRQVPLSEPRIPYVSNVTGLWITSAEATNPIYWARHVRQVVRFADGMAELSKDPRRILLEVGPGQTLSTLARQYLITKASPQTVLTSLSDSLPESCSMLNSLGKLWLAGVTAEWGGFYAKEERQRVPLPTYPFEPQRCWIESMQAELARKSLAPSRPEVTSEQLESSVPVGGVAEEFTQLLHRVTWIPRVLDAGPTAHSKLGPWLLFADKTGIASSVAAKLQAAGEQCTLVFAGRSNTVLANQSFEIRPDHQEDFESLLASPFEANALPYRGILYFWGLDAPSLPNATAEEIEIDVESSCNGVLLLLKALSRSARQKSTRLWLMTRGVQTIPPNDRSSAAAQSPLWGLGKVIVNEHPEFNCTRIDLSHEALGCEVDSAVKEFRSDSKDREIAFRGNVRYVARLKQFPLDQMKPELEPSANAITFSKSLTKKGLPDGTYLITGGFGGLGLEVAKWLVEQGVEHLVLVGRRGATDGSQALLEAFRKNGTQVLEAKVDISDSAQVQELFAEIEEKMPPVRGIFHAAGLLDDGVLLQLNRDRLHNVMGPKVAGSWNLHIASLKHPVELFVLFSAAATLLGTSGQGNYAAANAFLDALASYRRGVDLPALSINWGPWSDVGLAAARTNRGARLALRGLGSISPAIGMVSLAYLLRQTDSQSAVMAFNLEQWERFYPESASDPFFDELRSRQARPSTQPEPSNSPADLSQLLLSVEQGRRRSLLEAQLQQQIAKVLKIKPSDVDLNQPVKALGVDSLMALEIRRSLELLLGLQLPATLVYNYPTVAALAEYVAQQLKIDVAEPADSVGQIGQNESLTEQNESLELTAIMAEIELLSDEEVRQRTNEKMHGK